MPVVLYGSSDSDDAHNAKYDLDYQTRVIEEMRKQKMLVKSMTAVAPVSGLQYPRHCQSRPLRVCSKYCRLELFCVSCSPEADPQSIRDMINTF